MEQERLYTKNELAEMLHVHRNTITKMENRGVIWGIQLGTGAVRYSIDETIFQLRQATKLHKETRDKIKNYEAKY